LKEVKHVFPTYGVKRFSNVKLEKESQNFKLVESRCKVFDIEKVVMNATLFNEGTLCIGDKFVHEWGKTDGEQFGHDPSNPVD
jgi:hypothetical protein